MNAETTEKPKLVFVYNADAGFFDLLIDIAHKTFSPATYACNLRALAHGNFGMKKEWKAFLATLDAAPEFLHADKFARKYPSEKIELPAIFKQEAGELILLASAEIINRSRSIGELKERIKL